MNNKLITLAIVVLLICVGLSGCIDNSNSDNNSLYQSLDGNANAEIIGELVIYLANNYYHIMGKVIDNGETNIKDVKIIIDFYNNNDEFVYSHSTYLRTAFKGYIMDVGETCIFNTVIHEQNFPEYDYYEISFDFDKTNQKTYKDFSFENINAYYDDDKYTIVGKIKNVGSEIVDDNDNVYIWATIIDEDGNPLYQNDESIDGPLNPNEESSFMFTFYYLNDEINDYSLTAGRKEIWIG